MRWKAMLLLSTALGLGVGCADVKIRKVPTPTQYDKWNDDDQRKADSMEGFRYYMQRPFLSVFEPFPVHAKSYLVSGHTSADGRFVILDGLPACAGGADDELKQVMRLCYGCNGIPWTDVVTPPLMVADNSRAPSPPSPKAGPEGQQADEGPAAGNQAAMAEPTVLDPNLTKPLPNVIGGMDAPGSRGITDVGVKVVNDPYPMTPLRTKLFDIVNLPDFDEQFVVRRVDGIGSSTMDLTLGQGNLLQGFAAHLDNSSVANLMYGLLYTSANALAAQNINPMGLRSMLAGAVANVKPQMRTKGEGQQADESVVHEGLYPVTLRVHVISYATPGIYPVMKPRECADWARASMLRDECGCVRWSSPACQGRDGALVVRMGPYGVPYNTFQYVLVEHLDYGNLAGGVVSTGVQQTNSVEVDADAFAKELRAALKIDENSFRVDVLPTSVKVTVSILQLKATATIQDDVARDAWRAKIVEMITARSKQAGVIQLPPSKPMMQEIARHATEIAASAGGVVATVSDPVDGAIVVELSHPNAALSPPQGWDRFAAGFGLPLNEYLATRGADNHVVNARKKP